MDFITRRPDHIEDVLVKLHTGQWFGWSDSKNKVYANLIIHDKIWDETYTGNGHEEGLIDNPHSKPTQEFLESELQRMQEEFDGITYQRNRIKGVSGSYAASQGTGSIYPSTGEQFDMLYHELETSGSLTISGSWFNTIKSVKDANPKP